MDRGSIVSRKALDRAQKMRRSSWNRERPRRIIEEGERCCSMCGDIPGYNEGFTTNKINNLTF